MEGINGELLAGHLMEHHLEVEATSPSPTTAAAMSSLKVRAVTESWPKALVDRGGPQVIQAT